MKIKNISVGDFVQVKKRLVSNMFKAKQVCEVIRIDSEHKFRPDVLIKGEYCLEWVNHKDLKKPIKREPEPQLKQLDQSVFDGLDEGWQFAAVDDDGRAYGFMKKPVIDQDDPCFIDEDTTRCKWIGEGYDTTNWQNSLIERDIAKELLEVDLSSELTGSELCKAMIIGDRDWVLAYVSNENDATALFHKNAMVVTDFDLSEDAFYCRGENFAYAVPINNQGEPLTASEVGL